MEENTNVEIIERGYFDVASRRKSALISVLFYVAAMYVINLFIQIFLIVLAPIITGVDLYTTNEAGEQIINPQNEDFINAWTQILVYLILSIGLIIVNFKFLSEDIYDFKKNFKSGVCPWSGKLSSLESIGGKLKSPCLQK